MKITDYAGIEYEFTDSQIERILKTIVEVDQRGWTCYHHEARDRTIRFYIVDFEWYHQNPVGNMAFDSLKYKQEVIQEAIDDFIKKVGGNQNDRT